MSGTHASGVLLHRVRMLKHAGGVRTDEAHGANSMFRYSSDSMKARLIVR